MSAPQPAVRNLKGRGQSGYRGFGDSFIQKNCVGEGIVPDKDAPGALIQAKVIQELGRRMLAAEFDELLP
jgi:hypothetical protein